MIEEYNKSLQVFINQKNLLLDIANEKDLEPEILNNIINQICMLDDKIKVYNNLIKNENSKDNKIHNHIINDNDYNNEERQPNNSPENALNKMKTQNNYKKIIKNLSQEIIMIRKMKLKKKIRIKLIYANI